MARPQTGVVIDDSAPAIETGELTLDGVVVGSYKLKGWTPAMGDQVLLLRWGQTVVAIPIEAS
jgi:hypothetical protein